MYLKLGSTFICNSATDGATFELDAGVPSMNLQNDSVDIVGCYAIPISRGATRCEVKVKVGREFQSELAAASWAHAHLRALSRLGDGVLQIKDMLGMLFSYKGASLTGFDVTDQIGVCLDIEYTFTCGAPAVGHVLGIGENAVAFGNKLLKTKE